MIKNPIHCLNGKFVEDKDLVVPVSDMGFLRGYAIFDFLVTYNQKPFRLKKHVNRLFNSAKLIDLELPWSEQGIESLVLETLSKNESEAEKMMKIIISGGVGEMVQTGEPTLIITCRPRERNAKENYLNGVDVLMVEHLRYTPEAKTNNYIEGVKQTKVAHRRGAFQPIYYDHSQVYEGSNTNIFALIDGSWCTPSTNVLKGITRDTVLYKLEFSIGVKKKNFILEELLQAEEVFITGSNAEILSVTKIDGMPVGDGKVGTATKEVMEVFKKYTESSKW